MKNLTKEQILTMVKENRISAKEGVKLYKSCGISKEQKKMDIAVIGLSGLFPQAKNLEEFWDNLKSGTNSVQDITRWDPEEYYDPTPDTHNKSYCKSGGLLEGIDQFDPLFFELSPRQAELMEPRQRLFLQEAFRAIEDAGYTESQVKEKKVGVFLGCEGSTQYFKDLKEEEVCAHVFLGHSNAILASRISYFMNLQGPSLTIDTACSSSLVAIHSACESILSGNCEMALAGGVNIMTEPEMYILLSSMGMLSREGKCKAFDNQADGFVPGEAIGVILLKPLEAAIHDKDHIYGVIKGSGINQDGKTNGITAPSTLSQERLEKQVYQKFGINPEDISYVETHGTGTKLGDPIEFEALKRSFRNHTKKKNFCALGSVKTNIGHASAASGVTSLIKVLLAMKFKKLPPILHFSKLNEQITIEDSPFYFNTMLEDWKPENGKKRLAAISSFGHSGTNCHMVVEEWNTWEEELNKIQMPYYFIPFSSKSKESLRNYIKEFAKWITRQGQSYDIGSIAYNMMAYKNHFRERIALVVSDKEDLVKQLEWLIEKDFENCFEKKQSKQTFRADKNKIIDYFQEKDYTDSSACLMYLLKVKDLYLASDFEDAMMLYGDKIQPRISLPTYRFQEGHYWLEENHQKRKRLGNEKLATLIDSNESTLQELCYKKIFKGNEFFIRDHMNMLPAVVYLEMVRTVANLANKKGKIKSIRNSVWKKPILFEGKEKEVYVRLQGRNDLINYIVLTKDEQGNCEEHSQGKIEYFKDILEENQNGEFDVDEILERCRGGVDSTEIFYGRLESMGAVLGPRFRGLQEFYCNDQEAISVLDIPAELEGDRRDYVIHPTLADGGLQTVVTWAYHTCADLNTIYLPFVLGSFELVNPKNSPRYAYVKKSLKQSANEEQAIKYDIYYLDESGKVVYSMKDFCIRALEKLNGKAIKPETISVGYWNPVWKESNRPLAQLELKALVLFCLKQEDAKDFTEKNIQTITVIQGEKFKEVNNNNYVINPTSEEDYYSLFQDISKKFQSGFSVLHIWNMDKFESCHETMQKQIEQSLYCGFHMIRALQKIENENEIEVIFTYESKSVNDHPLYQALGGFCRSARLENPSIICKTVCVDPELMNKEEIIAMEFDERCNEDVEVHYQKDGNRLVKRLEEISKNNKPTDLPLRKNGVYLITGGLGGLGLLFADYLYREYQAQLILIGRSTLNTEKAEKLRLLQEKGCKVTYLCGDITKPDQVANITAKAKQQYGKINGVIHSAGVVKDSLLCKKKFKDFQDVIAPKVFGTVNLYEALKDEALDCFIMFSSTTAVLGNPGQSDYAYANSFMDQFAWMQNERGSNCKVYSINWPMWKDGGMHIDHGMQEYIEKTFGMKAISRELGESIFHDVISKDVCQQIVFAGDMEKIQRTLLNERKHPKKQSGKVEGDSDFITQLFCKDFMNIISELLKMKEEDIDVEQNMEVYGFDSITFTELANRINDKFNIEVNPSSFFGHGSLLALINMLVEEFADNIKSYYDKVMLKLNEEELYESKGAVYFEETSKNIADQYIFDEYIEDTDINEENAVAIIGMHGIMPQSDNPDEFWDNLLSKKNMISEIPKDRWNWEEYYGNPQEEDKTNVKWGGFMRRIDEFDPMFFHISGRDAEAMDPQERIVIKSVWKTIEDAGYKVSDLHHSNTGVFIGVTNADYAELMIQNKKPTVMTHTMITNRVSYLFDFTGPSETIDTACSSSLYALYRGVEEICNHTCEYVVAGGVNVIACPNLYIFQSKAGMLSPDGVCRTFDKDANGYVRGEGVGTVLLKSLKKAKRDGDHIYGVILGTGVNHNGHGNDLLAPSSNAQAKAIVTAIEQAGIDPETISYIETHGTGTKLGDPVEIEGIKKAFRKLYKDYGKTKHIEKTTGIGTVKTNIGHLESAAGIAGVIKVLLSMQNKKLPGLLHYHELNPYIQLEDSPLYIVKDNCDWKRRVNHENKEIPRRAGVSSFGIGGVNVHVVLQEYIGEQVKEVENNSQELILLSAKDSERLKIYAQNLRDYLIRNKKETPPKETDCNCTEETEHYIKQIITELLHMDEQDVAMQDNILEYALQPMQIAQLCERLNQTYDLQLSKEDIMEDISLKEFAESIVYAKKKIDPFHKENIFANYVADNMTLRNLAYTLQLGREEMDERLVFIASSIDEVCDKLEAYITNSISDDSIIYVGPVKKEKNKFFVEVEDEEKILSMLEERAFSQLGKLWSCGAKINWSVLYQGNSSKRISLPTYPFAKERYWIIEELEKKGIVVVEESNDEAMMALLERIACGEVKVEDTKLV